MKDILQKYAGLNMDRIFKQFYDVMLSTPDFAVYFSDDAQIQSLIARQQKFLLDSFALNIDEIKARYIKLGEMHYDINIPYGDYMAGMNILEEGLVSAVAKSIESEEQVAFTFRFFKQIRAFTAKGYLNRMLDADINDIDLYLSHVHRASDIDILLATERVVWLRKVISAIKLEDRIAVPDLNFPQELIAIIKSSTTVDPTLATYVSDMSARMETNARNVFYFIERRSYEEVLPLYRELMSIYKLTLMLTNVVTVASSNLLLKSSKKDALTQLLTRASFDSIVEKEISLATVAQLQLTFIMLDIDHFKDVNDNFGHAAGDEVLKVVARTLTGLLRSTDYCFRMGGEEFLIILKGATHKVAVTQTEIIRKAIENLEIKFKEQTIHATASFGVAVFGPNFDLPVTQMMEVSDKRLYGAKSSGRNRVNSGE